MPRLPQMTTEADHMWEHSSYQSYTPHVTHWDVDHLTHHMDDHIVLEESVESGQILMTYAANKITVEKWVDEKPRGLELDACVGPRGRSVFYSALPLVQQRWYYIKLDHYGINCKLVLLHHESPLYCKFQVVATKDMKAGDLLVLDPDDALIVAKSRFIIELSSDDGGSDDGEPTGINWGCGQDPYAEMVVPSDEAQPDEYQPLTETEPPDEDPANVTTEVDEADPMDHLHESDPEARRLADEATITSGCLQLLTAATGGLDALSAEGQAQLEAIMNAPSDEEVIEATVADPADPAPLVEVVATGLAVRARSVARRLPMVPDWGAAHGYPMGKAKTTATIEGERARKTASVEYGTIPVLAGCRAQWTERVYDAEASALNDRFFTDIKRQLQKRRCALEWLIAELSQDEIYCEKSLQAHKRRRFA